MSFAMSAGVTGLQAHQKMLDIAGNNLANVNTTAFKASRITFAELLSETVKKASQPTGTVGGTNPQQMGSGVGVAGITPMMSQGNIVNTGNPLDLALEGAGYLVLSDGSKNLYTRAGALSVDAQSNLVDPTTGYIVQRTGTVGEADGFQVAGNSNIRVPYDVAMPANATTEVKMAGNLSADAELATPATNVLISDLTFTSSSGTAAGATELLTALDQYTAGTLSSATITFAGYKAGATEVALGASPTTDLSMDVDATTTLQDILNHLNTDEGTAAVEELQTLTTDALATAGTFTLTYGGQTTAAIDFDATIAEIETALEALSSVSSGDITVGITGLDTAGTTTFTFADTLGDTDMITFDLSGLTGPTQAGSSMAETTEGYEVQGVLGAGAVATLDNGRIKITDVATGYSRSDLSMTFANSGTATLTMPTYFEISTAGGDEVKNINITVYDSLGAEHILSGAFVRTGASNTWDLVLTAISGDISNLTFDNRRIQDIEFDANNGSYKGLNTTTGDTAQFIVTFDHDPTNPQTISLTLGTKGAFDGLTQFAGHSTAVAKEQDGYAAGSFSSVSVNNEGIVIGAFSNGIKKSIATVRVALFQNPSGLEGAGGGYFSPSANSGEAVATQAMTGGAGTIHGGALEKSNADVATEFVNMIQAQNGFQANARTIRVANDILRELSGLIR